MRRRLVGPLAWRLAAAFLTVAVAAVALLAGLTLWSARDQVSGLASQQREERAGQIAATLAQAYQAAGGWSRADLSGPAALAAASDARLEVYDASGHSVAVRVDMQDLMNRMHGASGAAMGMGAMGGGMADTSGLPATGTPTTVDVVVGQRTVGSARLWFPTTLGSAEQGVRDALGRTVLVGAAFAALLAAVAAVAVSRRITRPLQGLGATARALEGGDRSARATTSAPGELGELAMAFNSMADAVQREDDVRRALVADVAHELRTPVTILRGECEQLVDGVAEPTPERLVSMQDELLRLSRVVEDLETLNAAQAATLRMERVPADLAVVASEVLRLLGPRFQSAGLTVESDLSPAPVEGDPARLHQVALNLLTNALKYTPDGGHVRVETGADPALARLVVADDGPGIPPDELPHVFERFWRGRGTAGTAGSGVGLAVVAELVRAHRGRVEAGARPGGGVEFRVLLPVP